MTRFKIASSKRTKLARKVGSVGHPSLAHLASLRNSNLSARSYSSPFSLSSGSRQKNRKLPKGLTSYRSEPLHMKPSPRMALGVPAGWEKNYFLEFAPNVGRLAGGGGPDTLTTKAKSPFATKEQMLEEFWKSLGMEDFQTAKPKDQETLKDFVPKIWEVRERLRNMISIHEEAVEDTFSAGKYPILTKGEVDPKLRAKRERISEKKKREELKESYDVSVLKKNQKINIKKFKEFLEVTPLNHTSTTSAAPERRKKAEKIYESTRKGYHKAVASCRKPR